MSREWRRAASARRRLIRKGRKPRWARARLIRQTVARAAERFVIPVGGVPLSAQVLADASTGMERHTAAATRPHKTEVRGARINIGMAPPGREQLVGSGRGGLAACRGKSTPAVCRVAARRHRLTPAFPARPARLFERK